MSINEKKRSEPGNINIVILVIILQLFFAKLPFSHFLIRTLQLNSYIKFQILPHPIVDYIIHFPPITFISNFPNLQSNIKLRYWQVKIRWRKTLQLFTLQWTNTTGAVLHVFCFAVVKYYRFYTAIINW